MFEDNNTMKVKICLVGEGAVGKTSLIRRYVLDEFDDRYISTLGAKITKKEISVPHPKGDGSIRVAMTIWDIMGEKGFRELLKEAYFHGAQGILAVSDITRRETLSELDSWIAAIEAVTGKIPIYFLANKADLEEHMTFGERELAEKCRSHSSSYLFTSAKTGQNVNLAFENISKQVVNQKAQ